MQESFPKLVIEEGPMRGQEVEIRRLEFTIGREYTQDLVIESPAVSRRHARLIRKGKQTIIEDLGSSNGTFVNGRQITSQTVLAPEDRIQLGKTIHLRFIGAPGEQNTEREPNIPPNVQKDNAETIVDSQAVPEANQETPMPVRDVLSPPPPPSRPANPAPPNPMPKLPGNGKATPALSETPDLGARSAKPAVMRPQPASTEAPSNASNLLAETTIGDERSLEQIGSAPRMEIVISGSQPQVYLLQGDRITLGRAEDNDIVIASRIISSHHAVLEKVDGIYLFHVLPQTTNPVYFEGRPLRDVVALRHGDLLRVGSSDPGMMVTIEYQAQASSRVAPPIQFKDNNRVQIGRDPSNDVVLTAPTISRFHAIVERVGQRFRVFDLKSANGTFVNDQRIGGEVWLKAGDFIRIGPYRFDMGTDELAQVENAGGMRVEILGLNKWVRPDLNLLKNISLIFEPREFVVVVGQSGGGKSTLLDAVAGFRPATNGRVVINDIDIYRNFNAIRNEIGFVPQRDIIHMELTVYQALDYAAQLRMPADTTPEERDQRIMEVLTDLDLVHRKDIQISGLSGGQQKRVSIGVELLTKPGLFFLDEPTSGLDPGTETSLMHLMRHLADQGRTIVLITHATKNVMLADKVVFLARGGFIAWFGPPDEALQYFDQFRSERDRHARSMEFDEIYAILDDASKGKPEEWAERYRRHPAYQEYIVKPLQAQGVSLQQISENRPGVKASINQPAIQPQRNQVSGLRQFLILSSRNIKILARDHASLVLMLISAPLVAMLDVLLAVVLGRDLLSFTVGDMANAVTSLFQPVMFAIMIGALSQMREFVKEADIYRRERLVNLKVLPYVMSKVWVAALLALYQAAAYTIVHYLAFKMPGGALEFGEFYVSLVLATLAGMMLGLLSSAVAPNANSAPLIVILLIVPQVVIGGALIPMPSNVSAFTISRWPFQSVMAISGAGSDVAADVCWALPKTVRDDMTLTDKSAHGCLCMGINALKQDSCNFPGLGKYYDPALDQAEPVKPADIGVPPPQPAMPPEPQKPADPTDQLAMSQYLQNLQAYQDQVQKIQDNYKAQMQDYQARSEVFKKQMTAYQTQYTQWEIDRAAAVGKAETVIGKFNDNFGWSFVNKHDNGIYWSTLIFTWVVEGAIIFALFILILFFTYRKDRVK